MSKKEMSECLLCGTKYEVCKFCTQVKRYTPWRQMCDSSRHFQINMIVLDYRKGILKAAEAKEQLEQLKVTVDEIKTFVPSVQETLLPIFETQKSNRKAQKKTDTQENIADESVIKEEAEADE